MPTPLPKASPAELGLDARQLDRLDTLIGRHIAEGRHAGAQIALARHGRIARVRSFGAARTGVEATDDTLFLLYSQTKMLTSATVWTLIEDGTLSFMDVVEDLLPGFAAHGKAAITLQQVMTHMGGFPSAGVTPASWADHRRMRAEVCAFTLDWEPGTKLQYHGQSAHQVQAMIIEEVTGLDYRQVIRERVLAPLGLERDIFVGVPDDQQARCADTGGRGPEENGAAFRAAGLPHAGAYATAKGMVQFYQMLAHRGRLGDVRLFSQRLLAYVARNHTGERPDLAMTGTPMHRGLGPHVRGDSDRIRGLGTLAAPETFGHGGVGSSYSWADPTTGVSFTFLTNFVQPDPWHSARLDRISNIVHAAID